MVYKLSCINGHSIYAVILYLSIILIQCQQSLNRRFECFHSKFKCMNVNIQISRFEISRYFVKCDFFNHGVFRWWRIVATKKRFMPQSGQISVLISTKMRKSFKKLSELELKFTPKAWRGKLWHTRPPPRPLLSLCWKYLLILTRLLLFYSFLFKPDNLV